MGMPRAEEAAREFFHSLLPEDGRVFVRPMFGNLAGFVNGHMFTGVFGSTVFVRLPEAEREELLGLPGATLFAPLPGREMREYAVLPEAWSGEPERAREWVERSLAWVEQWPPKVKKPKR